MSQTFAELRDQISQIDENIVQLLGERFKLALQIGEAKKQTGKTVLDADREKELLERLKGRTSDLSFSEADLVQIYTEILAVSRRLQAR